MKRKFDLREELHNLCNDYEIPAIDELENNLTRVRLATQTHIVNTAFQFDANNTGLQHYTPLGRVPLEERGRVAQQLLNNPPREITPVMNHKGIVGIQGAKSNIPDTRTGIQSTYIDIFGRIANFVDNVFPGIVDSPLD